MTYTYTIHYNLCDNILNNIRQNDDMHEVDIEPFLKEDRRVKLAIVRKLHKDGYIHRVSPQNDPFIISITVEGRQFWIDGGYEKYFAELREKNTLERKLLTTNILTNKSVIIQGIIAFLVFCFVVISSVYSD